MTDMDDNIIDFHRLKMEQGDHIVRGTAAGGFIRAFAINSRNTVQTARDAHNTSPLVTAALGRLMMSAQMMGFMMKNPEELITIIVRGDGPVEALTVTADTNGRVKGFANNPNVWLPLNERGKLDVGGGIGAGTLTVVRDQPYTEPYTSQVELVSGEIGDDMTNYFVVSDQVPTVVGVGVLVDRNMTVKQAGGFIIQLMPGYWDELADQLEANLAGVDSVTNMMEKGMTPTDILEHLLRGLDFKASEMAPVEFYCGCDEKRATRATLALGAAEIKDMIEKNEPAEVYCHFCGNRFNFTPEQLQQMLDDAGDSVAPVSEYFDKSEGLF